MTYRAFLSTLSLRRATNSRADYIERNKISIHALLAESDLRKTIPRGGHIRFLSTLSLRRATRRPIFFWQEEENFYPRSPCGERLSERVPLAELTSISIHALLAESDPRKTEVPGAIEISIHALLAESDTKPIDQHQACLQFLSTLSLRRATERESQH